MTKFHVALLGCLIALAISCAGGRTAAIPVGVSNTDLSRLTGEWTGTYESRSTGRSGTIVFNLTGEANVAYGNVMMHPGAIRSGGTESTSPPSRSPEAIKLAIRFVQFSEDRVSGMMEPYRDPATGATLETHFSGRVFDDRIEGAFITFSEGATLPQSGVWGVRRKQ